MSPLLTRNIACVFIVGSLIGCEKSDVKGTSPAMLSTSAPVRTGTAIIRGVVTLSGKPPDMAILPNQPCHAGAGPLREESVVVDPSGHLQNVVVYLEDAPPAPPRPMPAVVLDQVSCRYVPHVLSLQTGQTLHVTSSDPTLHNVHGMCSANDPFNFALVAAGQSRDLTFSRAEVFFPIRCDVHPWMKAYVCIFDHPYFTATKPDGSYEIHNVPPGTYTLIAWQEKYGTLKTRLKTENGRDTVTDFTFQSGW